MNRRITLALAALFLLMSGCALSESVRARKLLGNCQFALERVDLSLLSIAPTIRFEEKGKKISVENPPVKELLALIPQISKGEFKIDLSELKLKPVIAVDNPNDVPVILDSMVYDVFLDEGFLMKAEHNKTARIPANKTGNVVVDLSIPVDIPIVELVEAKEIVFKGTAYLKLNISSKKTVTLPVPVNVSRDIPREKIYAKIEEEKEKVVKELLKNVSNKGAKKVLDAFF